MADFFVWDASTLSVKVEEMDAEHRVLIRKMNALHTAYSEKACREVQGPLLFDLAKYATEHFADEEAYMARIKFPGIESHKLIHKKLLTRVGEFVLEFEKTGALDDAFFNFLSFWLLSHIRGIDVKYSAHAESTKSA